MIAAPPRTIQEVFESLPEGTLCELINNKIVMPPSPSFEHQDLSADIFFHLRTFVAAHQLGKVLTAPLDVYLGRDNVFQPDILFIASERLNIVQAGKVRGAPDLIIEILSPGTERYDYNEKREVYEQFGVKEYWLVDTASKKVTGYTLQGDAFIEMPSTTGIINSTLLGTSFRF